MTVHVTHTSIDSYLDLFPHLEKRCSTVLKGVLNFLSANRGFRDVTGRELNVFLNDPDAHKRLKDLADRGLLYITQERPSQVKGSNKRAQAWAPTDNTSMIPTVVVSIPRRDHKQRLIDKLNEITTGWVCCCKPGYERCAYCKVQDAIENR